MTERAVVFQAVGDITLGDHPLCAGFGTHSALRAKPPGFAFEHVAGLFKRADLLFGNLECTLSEEGLRPGDYHSVQMRGHGAYSEGLKGTGFDVLNVANNHSLQHGPMPFLQTVQLLRHAGIGVCGVAIGGRRRATPTVVKCNGLSVVFLGYSLRPRQYFTEVPLYAEGDAEHILDDVRAARSTADVVIVSVHWGDEFIDRPSPREIELAHDVMQSGADLIIGHHPHVLRGVERYGRGYIVYSLGNFVCDMLWDEPLRESAIAECRLTPAGVSDLRLIPVRIADDYRPMPLHGSAAAALTERLARLSDRFGVSGERALAAAIAQYAVDAARAHRESRGKSHRYFLRNAFRCPPRLVAQQLATFVRNRCIERGLIRTSPPTSA
jgi:poly-gamma-glutamate synthesis protein (capsule biosynthesis protein)